MLAHERGVWQETKRIIICARSSVADTYAVFENPDDKPAATVATIYFRQRIRLRGPAPRTANRGVQVPLGSNDRGQGFEVAPAQTMKYGCQNREGGDDDRSRADNSNSRVTFRREVNDVDEANGEKVNGHERRDSSPDKLPRQIRQRQQASVRRGHRQQADGNCKLPELLVPGLCPNAKDYENGGQQRENRTRRREEHPPLALPKGASGERANACGRNCERGEDDSDLKFAKASRKDNDDPEDHTRHDRRNQKPQRDLFRTHRRLAFRAGISAELPLIAECQ